MISNEEKNPKIKLWALERFDINLSYEIFKSVLFFDILHHVWCITILCVNFLVGPWVHNWWQGNIGSSGQQAMFWTNIDQVLWHNIFHQALGGITVLLDLLSFSGMRCWKCVYTGINQNAWLSILHVYNAIERLFNEVRFLDIYISKQSPAYFVHISSNLHEEQEVL